MENEYLNEKVSVNMNTSTLAGIDALVDNGFYSNRSDFINQAVRELLHKQQGVLDRIAEQKTLSANPDKWFIGLSSIEACELEEAKRRELRMSIRGYGVLFIGGDVDPQLLFDTVEEIRVKGRVKCSDEIKAHYGLKK